MSSTRRLSWCTAHAVDLAFAAVICTAFSYLVAITANGWFFLDDWGLIEQSGSLGGIFQPYNDHMSVGILMIYRGLLEVFGFEHQPYQVVGLLFVLAIPVLYHLTTRRFLGPPLAAVAALTTVAYTNLELRPSSLNHYLVVLGAIGCGAALNRGPRADWVLGAAVAVALSGAGGGVAVAAGCVAHNACVRAPWRRWAVVLGPAAAWGIWFLLVSGGTESRFERVPSHREALATARTIAWTPFEHLGLQNVFLAAVIAAAFVAYGVARLRQGLDAASNFLAWTAALAVWSGGLGYSRGADALVNGFWQLGDIVFRYQVVTITLVLLAVVPRSRIHGPGPLRVPADRRWTMAAAGVILLLGLVGGLANRSAVSARAEAYERKGLEMRSVVLELRAGNETRFPMPGLAFFTLQADEVLALLDRFGQPSEGRLPLPDPPTIVAEVTARDGGATLSWTAPAWTGGSPIIGYVVTPYVGLGPQPRQQFASAATTQTVTGLTNGETYRFKVQAVTDIGPSGYSSATDPVTPRPSTSN